MRLIPYLVSVLLAVSTPVASFAEPKANLTTIERSSGNFYTLVQEHYLQIDKLRDSLAETKKKKETLMGLEKKLLGLKKEEETFELPELPVIPIIPATPARRLPYRGNAMRGIGSKPLSEFDKVTLTDGRITSTDFEIILDEQRVLYQLSSSFMGGYALSEIILDSQGNMVERRFFKDVSGDGFKFNPDCNEYYNTRVIADYFTLQKGVNNNYKIDFSYCQDYYRSLDVSADDLNQTLAGILQKLFPLVRKNNAEMRTFIVANEKDNVRLDKDISAKTVEIESRLEQIKDEEKRRKKEAEQEKKRSILGPSYESDIKIDSLEGLAKSHLSSDRFIDLINAVDDLDDIKNVIRLRRIHYAEGKEYRESVNASYRSPLDTHNRTYGVCDELAMYLSPFLLHLGYEVHLYAFGENKPNGKYDGHVVTIFYRPNKGWGYTSNTQIHDLGYRSEKEALDEAKLSSGYSHKAAINGPVKLDLSSQKWITNNTASARLGP